MEIIAYSNGLPDEAKKIREAVFVKEQGFQEEFDGEDGRATHFLAWLDGVAVGTCRVYFHSQINGYLIGRIAVKKEFRGKKIGAEMLKEATTFLMEKGARQAYLHAQVQAKPFYEKQGFLAFGDEDQDEGCPHIWMKKEL